MILISYFVRYILELQVLWQKIYLVTNVAIAKLYNQINRHFHHVNVTKKVRQKNNDKNRQAN